MRVKKIASVEFALRIRPLELGRFMLLISGVGWPEAKIQSRIVSHPGHDDDDNDDHHHHHDDDDDDDHHHHDEEEEEEEGEEADGDDGNDNDSEYVTWMPYSSEE